MVFLIIVATYKPIYWRSDKSGARIQRYCGSNEGYVGTLPMNEALKNRFVVIQVDYIDGDILKTLLSNKVNFKMMLLLNKSSNSMRIYVQCLNKDKFLKKRLVSEH